MRRFLPFLALLAAAVFVAAWFEGRRRTPPRVVEFPADAPAPSGGPMLAAPIEPAGPVAEARPDEGEVRLVDGRPAARGELWFDELSADGGLVRERKAAIRDGRYRLDGPRPLRLLPRAAQLAGAPAIVVAPLAPFEPDAAPPLVELRAMEPWRLRVVAAEDGVDLEEVEVCGLQARDDEGLVLPRTRYGVARDARSPVVLPDPPRRRWSEPSTAWVRAKGRAWGRIDLVRADESGATLALEPACRLVLDARALAGAPVRELVVARLDEGRARVVARAAWADEVAFDGLAPGEHAIEASGLGADSALRVALVGGAESRASFAAPGAVAPRGPAVALTGELSVHPSWMDKPRRFGLALVGGGRADRAPLGAPERRAGGWTRSFDLLVPEGAHELLVDDQWPVALVAAPGAALRLELPPRVRTSFVGGEQATLELRPARGEHEWRQAAPGATSLDLPEGEWSLRSARASPASIAERRVLLSAPEAVVELESAPRGVVRLEVAQDGRARPFEAHWGAWLVDGSGSSVERFAPDPLLRWSSAVAVPPEGAALRIPTFLVDGRPTREVHVAPLAKGEVRLVRIELAP